MKMSSEARVASLRVRVRACVRACVRVCVCSQSCLTLCDPRDSSPPGSSVHRNFQAGKVEWVAISSFTRSSWHRDRMCVSLPSWNGRQILYHCATWETHARCIDSLIRNLMKSWVRCQSDIANFLVPGHHTIIRKKNSNETLNICYYFVHS